MNLSLVSDVQVINEVGSNSEAPQSLNLQKLNYRLQEQIEEKKRLVKALQAGASPEAHELYITISKTIPKQNLSWKGNSISVFNQVIIEPPYHVENVLGDSAHPTYTYIKKIVSLKGLVVEINV